MLQQDQKNLVASIKKLQSEITATLLDPKVSGPFLNSVNLPSEAKNEEESQL